MKTSDVYLKKAGFMTNTSISHKGAINTLWLHVWGSIMASIFIYSLDQVTWNLSRWLNNMYSIIYIHIFQSINSVIYSSNTVNQWIDLYYPKWHPHNLHRGGGLHVRSSWRLAGRHLCGLGSGVCWSSVLLVAPELRLINDARLSGRIAHWHTSHRRASLISQWTWPRTDPRSKEKGHVDHRGPGGTVVVKYGFTSGHVPFTWWDSTSWLFSTGVKVNTLGLVIKNPLETFIKIFYCNDISASSIKTSLRTYDICFI